MSASLRVLVNGARGRMGALSAGVVRDAVDLELVGETDLGDDLEAAVRDSRAQVAIDFTHHTVALDCLTTIVRAGARPVCGTSGFSAAEVEAARRLVREAGLGGLIVPNFSIGAVLMMEFARQAARRFAHVEIVEMHHDRKGDAPSGTAERTAEIVSAERGDPPAPKVAETERHPGARGARVLGVPVHSLRLPGLLAHQEVVFSGEGEVLTVRHDTMQRSCFNQGILLAVRRVSELTELVCGLEHLL